MVIVSVVLAAGLVLLWRTIGFDGGRWVDDAPSGSRASGSPYQATPYQAPQAPPAPAAVPLTSQATPAARPAPYQPPVAPAPAPYQASNASSSPAAPAWPFGNFSQGAEFDIPSDDPYTGFLVVCSDDQDASREVSSVASVAAQWDYPMLMAIGRTFRGTGWTDRLDGLRGNVGQYDMRVDEIQALRPVRLPIVAFVSDGRVVEASAQLDSPSAIATSFQSHRSGVAR